MAEPHRQIWPPDGSLHQQAARCRACGRKGLEFNARVPEIAPVPKLCTRSMVSVTSTRRVGYVGRPYSLEWTLFSAASTIYLHFLEPCRIESTSMARSFAR